MSENIAINVLLLKICFHKSYQTCSDSAFAEMDHQEVSLSIALNEVSCSISLGDFELSADNCQVF